MDRSQSKLAGLKQLCQARLDFESALLQPILAEEAELLRAIQELRTPSENGVETFAIRRIGGDIAWQKWADARLRELNMYLARNRVRKLAAIKKLQQAHGRNEAAQAMVTKSKAQALQARTKAMHQTLLDQICTR